MTYVDATNDSIMPKSVKAFLYIAVGLSLLIILLLVMIQYKKAGGNENENNALYSNELSQCTEEKNEAIAKQTDVGTITSAYQKCIDIAEANDKAALYTERAGRIAEMDREKENKSQVFADVIAADNLLQTTDSAATVANYASYYGDAEVMNQYLSLLRQRQIEKGLDPDAEAEG